MSGMEAQAKLIEAARYGSEGGVRFFVKRVENVNYGDETGRTALHWAVVKPSPDCVAMLLAAGADHARKTVDGDTPLHLAAKLGHLEVQRMLIKAGADTQVKNLDGLSPADLAKARKP